MAEEFQPITTQEELNAVVGERLKREREATAKRYGDYDNLKTQVADYEKQVADLTKAAEESAKKYADYDKQLSDRDAKIKSYETASVKSRIAHEVGLPYGMASRLSGETEEDIKKDAEALKALIGVSKPTAPLRTSTPPADDSKSAFRGMLKTLKGE